MPLPRWWGIVPVVAIAALLGVRAAVHVAPRDRLVAAASDPHDPPDTTAATGTLWVPRGGPLIIGFQAAHDARLTIAGVELHGHGLVTRRVIVPHGPYGLRFAATGDDARLVWSPPGRRGDPDYVGASSLSPDPPERAQFDDSAGSTPVDGAIALAILAILVGTLCVLARRRIGAMPRGMALAMAAILVAGVAVRWIDLGGAGETWDEGVYWAAGKNDVTNLLALDFHQPSWIWNQEHPPITKYLDGIGAQFADGYGPARALSAIWIALGCALLVPIGARLYGLRVGVLAAAVASLLPPLIAHGKVVGHESPAVLFWMLGILLALGVHDGAPAVVDRAWRRTLVVRLAWCGVVLGVAIASRFVNALLGPLLGVIVLVQAPAAWRRATLAWGALILPVVAVVTVVVLWPRLWSSPAAHLAESWAKLSKGHSDEPFLGTTTNHPPPYYFVVYLMATAPIGVLLGAAAWMVRAARRAELRATLVVVAWFVIPLGVMLSPVRQDGVRYVMPCVVVLALAAAAGLDAAVARWSRGFPIAAAVLIAYLGVVDVRIHPYYLDYFGEQVGGAGTVDANHWFETAWWGEGIDRAVDYVNAHAAPGAAVYRDCIDPVHVAWFREDLWPTLAVDPARASWWIAYAPLSHPCRIPADARKVFTLTAAGAPLAEVWQR